MNWRQHFRDIERGEIPRIVIPEGTTRRLACYFQRLGTYIKTYFNHARTDAPLRSFQGPQIEDLPKGYPQFSALMAAHESFQVFRRFAPLRMRLLLKIQDRISQLESKVNEIDENEARPIFLSSNRRDTNTERRGIEHELKKSIREYDEMLEANFRVNKFSNAQSSEITSLQNWNASNGCISRQEVEFLSHSQDLLYLSTSKPTLQSWLERCVLNRLIRFSEKGRSLVSRDPLVHIYPQQYVTRFTRLIITPLLILIVITPMVICNIFESPQARLAIIILATSIFLMILALFTTGKALDLAVAGATYTTVLVVFIS